ncbi:MAG: lytic transglycosylase [Thalassobium sp.]|nr:MAG: lytic transglycosylase [Oceanospirillales bacterium]PHQ88094.1 MAG: lytic transglycosylase [Thalassobium sp.]
MPAKLTNPIGYPSTLKRQQALSIVSLQPRLLCFDFYTITVSHLAPFTLLAVRSELRLTEPKLHCNHMKHISLWLFALIFTGCSTTQPVTLAPIGDSETVQELEVLDQWQADQTAKTEYENIWERVIASYKLDTELDNDRITAQLNWYRSHPSYIDRVADRGVRYLYFIAEQIEAREVPGELALLPVVESAFDPFAYSHGRASGVWQFIPSTGRDFGLQQDWWHDGRRDIRAATEAALSYLDALQQQFDGDWLLALASYNSGAGTVRKAIRKNREKGLPTDFWSLDLPRETQAYVPKLIALAKLIKYPERYGLTLTPIEDKPYFAVVNTGGQIDLSQVAELADTDLDEVYKLNPGFNRWATRPTGPHEVLIPVEKQELFEQRLTELPSSERVRWQRYQVKNGDSLNTIARHYSTTPDALQQANELRSNTIFAGQQLLIPSAFKSQDTYSHSLSQRMERIKNLRKPKNSNQRIEYNVQSGDSFWEIARNHDVTVSQLASWNGLAPKDPLRVGQKLVIWSAQKASSKREVIRKINYRVRNGDSLAGISQKFKVSMADLKRWNSNEVRKKYIQPGQKLTLYVDVTR